MLRAILGLLCALSLCLSAKTELVLLGDPHLPGNNVAAKERVIEQINQRASVDAVIALGDICSKTGTREELAMAKAFFAKLTKPLYIINGNHDFIYDDQLDANNKLQHAPHEIQMQKLEAFKQAFHLKQLYYSVQKENYLLIFLSANEPSNLAKLSDEERAWFENELKTHSKMPTIVFFHAPLDNTLENYNHWANTPNFIAQPKEKIHELIRNHPQLFLWVSGHTHTSAKEPSFAASINRYEQVTNIHNSDMNKETIWTNTLLLDENSVTIKTYNHQKNEWIPALERHIAVPKF